MGMGNASTATGSSTSALYDNPANLPFSRVYHFEAWAKLVPEAARQSYGAAVADSVTNRVAGGASGSYSMMDPDGINRKWIDARVSLAYPVADWLAVGIAGRYVNMYQDVGKGPFGSSLASDGTPGGAVWNGFTADAGITVQPLTGFRIGVVGHNLTVPGTSLLPTTLSSGIGYVNDVFSLEADTLIDFTTWTNKPRPRVSVGGEIFLASRFAIRAGWRFDAGQKVHAVSLGLGYVDKRFGVELSGRRDVVADHPATTMMLSLRYFYDAVGTPDSIGTME